MKLVFDESLVNIIIWESEKEKGWGYGKKQNNWNNNNNNNTNNINSDAKETISMEKGSISFYMVFAQVKTFLWLEYSPNFYKAI